MEADRAAEAAAAGDVGEEGRRVWVADAVPLPVAIDEEDSPRPVVTLVLADGLILHQNILGRLAGEADAVADALADAVVEAAKRLGWYPEAVIVRHEEVAAALGPALAGKEVDVRCDASPPHLESAVRSLVEAFGGYGIWPPVGRSEAWRGWGLPSELVARLFEVAAGFYRAAPWRGMLNEQAPRATLPSGRQWTACVMGNAEEVFGLALYSEPEDVVSLFTADSLAPGFESIRGRMVSLTYDPVAQLGPKARKELALARWKLAGPAAYPDLMTGNTPGGGVSREDVRDLIALLDALPRFREANAALLEEEQETELPSEPIDWTDPRTGVRFEYESMEELLEPATIADEIGAEVRAMLPEIEAALGPDASYDQVVNEINERLRAKMDTHNRKPLAELFGHTPHEVQRLLSADWSAKGGAIELNGALSLSDLAGSEVLERARALLSLAAAANGLGRTQAGNLQVAVVRQLIERVGLSGLAAAYADLPTVRGPREQEVWPVHEVRVLSERAGLLRARKARFELTKKGRDLAAPDRAGELFARLFETCFRRFNIFYGGYMEWPELQYQMAFTLMRLSRVGRDWLEAEDLLDETVLPAAMEALPDTRGFVDGGWLFRRHVLRRLESFGLLEHREGEAADEYRLAPLFDRFLSFADAG